MIKAVCIYLIMMFVFYLLGSFVNWELNPKLWGEGGRFVLAIIGSIISGVVSLIYYLENQK